MSSIIGSSIIGGASLLKEINRNVILNEIRINGPLSRADLVAATGLRFPTVIRIVDAFVEEKIIQEIGKGETATGRKPTMLAINPEAAYIVGVVVGHRMIVILTDFLGNIVDEYIENMELQDGPEYVADISYQLVKDILVKNNLSFDDIAGIGIATPGMDFKTSIGCEDPTTLACWHSANTAEIFYKKFEGSLVKIGMLPVCGAIGEQWFGKTKNSKNNIYVYVDKGVGAGVIVDGKTFLGKDGFAGHIGHATIDMTGPLCYCGNNGCLETFTSSIYIVSKVREKIAEGALSSLNELIKGDISKIKFDAQKGLLEAEKNLINEQKALAKARKEFDDEIKKLKDGK